VARPVPVGTVFVKTFFDDRPGASGTTAWRPIEIRLVRRTADPFAEFECAAYQRFDGAQRRRHRGSHHLRLAFGWSPDARRCSRACGFFAAASKRTGNAILATRTTGRHAAFTCHPPNRA
jgi:hypothetical protein